jgi:hypothetical protein
MGERVHLDGQSFLQPRLGLGVIRFEGISHDADGCPPVDFLQALENGAEERLVLFGSAHIVYAQCYHGFYPLLAHPLWRSQFREIEMWVKGITSA